MDSLQKQLELALGLLKSPDKRLAAWHLNLAETLESIKRQIEQLGI